MNHALDDFIIERQKIPKMNIIVVILLIMVVFVIEQ